VSIYVDDERRGVVTAAGSARGVDLTGYELLPYSAFALHRPVVEHSKLGVFRDLLASQLGPAGGKWALMADVKGRNSSSSAKDFVPDRL
jgi:hypothetical protein